MPPLGYNPDLAIKAFDFIVADEFSRTVNGPWWQELEFFDARSSVSPLRKPHCQGREPSAG